VVVNWIHTDEMEDVAGSLRHVVRAAQFVGADPQSYKWVLLAMHSALQGACVCHLTTTAAPIGAVSKRNAAEWLAYFEHSRADPELKPPQTHLMHLPGLLKAVRKPRSAGDGRNASGVKVSEIELNWLRRFHDDLRNQFVHFAPTGWSIEVSGVPELLKLVARIIEDIYDIGWAFRHQDAARRQELRTNIDALTKIEWPV